MTEIRGCEMILFFKCLPRLIHRANADIRRHFTMTFSSALSIGVALLIAMLMVVSAVNVNQFTQNIEEEFIVQISLDPTLNDEQINELENEVSSMKHVASVTFSSKEEELDKLIEENGNMFSQYEGDNNPLYDVLIAELDDNTAMESFTNKVSKMDGVMKATYGGSAIVTLINLFEAIRYGGSIFVVVMVVLAIFLIRNTIKMTIRIRKDEIAIMRQVGAYSWYISVPFMLEGMVTGLIGALGPMLICGFGYTYLYQALNGSLMSDMFRLIEPFPFVIWVCLGLLIVGGFVGMIGSLLATRKYLRWAR